MTASHTQMKCLDRGKFHMVICFFLNTGLWGGIFFFQLLKKKAQKCVCEGGKRQKLSNSFPWRDMKKTESIVERIHFSHHWASCILLLVH